MINEPSLTLKSFADLIDLSERRVRTLIDEKKLPAPTAGMMPLATGVRAYIVFLRQLGGSNSPAIEAEKLATMKAKREMAERKNRIQKKLEAKDYMPTDEVSEILQIGIKSLELIPEKISSEFATPPAQTKRLTQLLDEARADWVSQIKAMPDPEK